VIVLDTNVLSVLMHDVPDPAVIAWLDDQSIESVWTTTITTFEVRLGLEAMPAGRRRARFEAAFERLVSEDLQDRVLAFDREAANAAARLAAIRRRLGRPVEIRDSQIAGIVAMRRATLATRNVHDFEGVNLRVVNPWSP
jgi:predicted nucleic acid-binding protein